MDARRARWFQRSTMRILIVYAQVFTCSAHSYDDSNIEDVIGLSTSEVLHLRGYLANDLTVRTLDGYVLNLVEAYNPLINYSDNPALANKEVVLFIHGTLFNATGFICHAPEPVTPKDFSHLNASEMNYEELVELYDGSPNVESLVFMLLDFGHKIFLLNRRNTIASQQAYSKNNAVSAEEDQGDDDYQTDARSLFDLADSLTGWNPFSNHDGLLTLAVDENYWNFSLDEMAKYDLPDTIEYILKLTNRSTLAAVGWSSGGAIIEMGLSTQPTLNEKISKSLLWSPSLYLGRSIRDKVFFILGEPLLSRYIGPFPTQFVSNIFITLAKLLCGFDLTLNTICQWPIDLIAGYGGDQRLLKPGFYNSFPAPVSSHEYAQLGQISINKKSRFYSFGQAKNRVVYGSSKPPLYDVSKITSKGLYFWGAANDGLVDIEDVASNVNDLSVEAVFTRLDQPGLYFEHLSYLWHKNKSELLYIPSLRILES